MLYIFDSDKRMCCCNKGGVCSVESLLFIDWRRECLSEEDGMVRKLSWGEEGINEIFEYEQVWEDSNNFFPIVRWWWIKRRDTRLRESGIEKRQEA